MTDVASLVIAFVVLLSGVTATLVRAVMTTESRFLKEFDAILVCLVWGGTVVAFSFYSAAGAPAGVS